MTLSEKEKMLAGEVWAQCLARGRLRHLSKRDYRRQQRRFAAKIQKVSELLLAQREAGNHAG